MRITKISVRELFGIPTFNYDIELKLDKRITIIHGPNGSGKTVLFKMIDGLFNGRYFIFWKYPFSEFTVTLDNNETIVVRRSFDSKTKNYMFPEITYSRAKQPMRLNINREYLRFASTTQRRLFREWEYETFIRFSRDTELNPEEYIGIAEFLSKIDEDDLVGIINEPSWLENLRGKLKVNFINTNRLLVNKPDENSNKRQTLLTATAINENSKDLALRIQEKILEADTQAKILDRTFPSRVVASVITEKRNSLGYEKIRERLDQLESQRKRLTEAGLLEAGSQQTEFQVPESIDNTQQERTLRTVLTMYIKDTEEKLKVYQELADKIELYKRIIKDMLRHKNLHISSKNGFQLQSDTGQAIPLHELSSGEQHLLVLVYNLLFRKKDKTDELILIDEPEISLHISWQKRFIDDLLLINKLADFDVIIATHSPGIINGRLDLMVGIQGATGKEDL